MPWHLRLWGYHRKKNLLVLTSFAVRLAKKYVYIVGWTRGWAQFFFYMFIMYKDISSNKYIYISTIWFSFFHLGKVAQIIRYVQTMLRKPCNINLNSFRRNNTVIILLPERYVPAFTLYRRKWCLKMSVIF